MELLENATANVPEFSLNGRLMQAKVVSCYDGDTFYAVLNLDGSLWKFNCRMAGYDTPEMKPAANKPGREIEKARAMKARQALIMHVCDGGITMDRSYTKGELDGLLAKNKKIITIYCKEFDKYGRLLVEVPLKVEDAATLTLNDWMVEKGYGYKYNGGTKDTAFGVSTT